MISTYRNWTNWARTQSCFTKVRTPCSRGALLDAIPRALKEGKIRVAGGSNSWSPLVPTTGTIFDVSRLDDVIDFQPSPTNTVTVEPGITTEKLTAYLAARGYSLKCPTLFPKPTIGGAIAAGCHGTGTWWGPFSDSVVGVEFVDGLGRLQRIDPTDPNALAAARVSLGLLGVMTSVTLAIETDFHLDVYVRELSVKDTMNDLAGLLASHEYVFFMGFPFNDTLWARLGNRTTAPVDPYTVRERLTEKFEATFETLSGKTVLPVLARRFPECTPGLLVLANKTSNDSEHDVELASRAMHHQKAYPRAVTMSFSVPIASAANAWLGIDGIVRWYRARGMYPVNMAYVARFVGASQAYLSPALGRPSCFFEVTTAVETPDQDEFFLDAWKFLSSIPDARPHWAKRWETRFSPKDLYGAAFTEFKKQQTRFDPESKFVNEWLADLGF